MITAGFVRIVPLCKISRQVGHIKFAQLPKGKRFQRIHHRIVHLFRGIGRQVVIGQRSFAHNVVDIGSGVLGIAAHTDRYTVALCVQRSVDIAVVQPEGNVNAGHLFDVRLAGKILWQQRLLAAQGKQRLLCRLFILRGAGRRTEHQRIGNDCGAKQPCDFLIHFHVIFLIQIINNRTCAAYRLIAEKYGQRRFHTAQSVMVDNFQNFCLINAINCLPLLIMVNQYNFLIIHIQQGASGKHAAILPISIQNREISVADFCQCITDVADEILSAEGNQMILFHKITHGCRLRNQSCYHQGIMRCADDFAVIFLCQLLNCLRNRCASTNHDAACVHLDTAKLIFKTVPGQKHIAIFYIVFQQIRICRTNQNFPLCNFFLGIADNHCTINRIQNIRIFCVDIARIRVS